MSGETILITRPQGEEQSLTDLLHEHGSRVIHEPLTSIFLYHTERQVISKALENEPNAFIITSKHGAQALALLSDLRDVMLICVGDATARYAMSLGFTRVSAAGGNAKKLCQYITDGYDEDSRFIYISGKDISTDLVETLCAFGMQVERVVAYEALPSPQLSDTLIEQLRREQLDAVTFLSMRTAEVFIQLLEKAGISDSTKQLHVFCMSEQIAQPLTSHGSRYMCRTKQRLHLCYSQWIMHLNNK